MIASHEPGVRGVMRAARPIKIRMMPTHLFIFGLSSICFLTISSNLINNYNSEQVSFGALGGSRTPIRGLEDRCSIH